MPRNIEGRAFQAEATTRAKSLMWVCERHVARIAERSVGYFLVK